jgi:hypothetical protein
VEILRSPDKRLGQVGNTCGKWDNSFHTRGYIQDIPLDVLIDNGSTTTILSNHIFIQMMHKKKDLELQHAECTLIVFLDRTLHTISASPPIQHYIFPNSVVKICFL